MTKGCHVGTFLTNCTAYNSFVVPAAAPWLKTVVALDNQRASVSWFRLSRDDFGALFLRGYRVYYLSQRNYQTRNVTVRPDQLQVELTDLDPDTWYRIWIAAFTTMGEGPRSYGYWIKTCKWSTTSFVSLSSIFGLISGAFIENNWLLLYFLRTKMALFCFWNIFFWWFKCVGGQFLNGLAKLSLLGSLTTLKLVTAYGVTLLPRTTRYFWSRSQVSIYLLRGTAGKKIFHSCKFWLSKHVVWIEASKLEV